MSTKKPIAKAKPTTAVDDPDDLKGTLKHIGGSQSDTWNKVLGNQALNALWLENTDPETRDQRLLATVAALAGIGPKDEIEAMIAAQLIAAHNATMECYRRAMRGEQTLEGRRENLNQANKLSRTYATVLEALNRHRGKGQQKVTVEHVHVHSGGQAIVGTVESRRGGSASESQEDDYAKQIAHAPQPAMRGPNTEPTIVPSASDAERPLPDARRDVARCTEG